MNDRFREIEARVAALELGREIDLDGLRDCYIQDVRQLLALLEQSRRAPTYLIGPLVQLDRGL